MTRLPLVTTWPTCACEVLTRIRDDRVFYTDPPARPNRPLNRAGDPLVMGGDSSARIGEPGRKPDDSLVTSDPRYGTVRVQAWHGLHPKLTRRGHWSDSQTIPIVRGSVIRVEVEHLPKPTSRAKKTLWLLWSGPGDPDLDRCWRAYLRRFDIEHTFRFMKDTLGWTTPSLCTPEQADRWSWLIAGAYTQLRLARGLVDDLRLPWERPRNLEHSPRLGCGEGFDDFVQRSAHRPVHRNRQGPDRDARKGHENRPESAIQRSKGLRDQRVEV